MQNGFVYAGTKRRAHHDDPHDVAFGIYILRRIENGGGLSAAGMTPTPEPGWLTLHPHAPFLYAVNEVRHFDGAEGGGISAFAIDREAGSLTLLNSQRTAALPCHCAVDASGRYLLVATYGGGSVHLYRLHPDGSIGREVDAHRHTGSSVHPRRQTQPHAHAVVIDPSNRFVLVPDLGIDRVMIYALDLVAEKLLAYRTVVVAPGSGPRHIVFHPQAPFVYLMNELSASITVFHWDAASGSLHSLQTIDALPEGFEGLRSGGAIAVHPSGGFVYATTRSHGSSGEPPVRGLDSLVWFAIDPEDGTLREGTRIFSGGEIPRAFAFDRDGDRLFVAHQSSGTVVTFAIDPATGMATATGDVVASPVPLCLQFSPQG